mgnify:CR=1 FL=1
MRIVFCADCLQLVLEIDDLVRCTGLYLWPHALICTNADFLFSPADL